IADITIQKAAENSLIESETKYRSLYTLFRTMADNLPDMIWAKDLNKKYLFSNEALCKGLLIAKNTQEPIGKTDLFFANRQRKIKPNNKKYHTFGELCQNSDDIVLKSQKAQRFDEYGNVKNKFLFLDVYKAPFYDLNGNIIGTVGSARDITKEIKMENALNTIEEKYKKIFELVPTSIIITDNKGLIVDVNSNKEHIITEKSFAKTECKGKRLLDAKTIIEAGLVGDIKKLLKGKGFESKEHYFPLTAFGYPGYLNIQGVPILEKNKVVGAVISSENITERVQLAKTLKDNEEYFKFLFYSNPLPMYVFDPKSLNFLDVNQAIIDKYGFTREEFFEMTLFDIRPPEEKKKLIEDVKNLDNGIERRGIWKHKKKNGELIYVDVTTFDINFFGRKGKLVMANDITQSIQNRKELEKSQKQIRLFADHLELVREKERTNIAREIHDNLGQSLTALKIDLSWLSNNYEKSNDIIQDKIKASKELINSLIKTVQKISTELRPGIIDDLGLAAAIEWQVDEFKKRTGIKCNLDISPSNLNLNEQLSVNIFRIIQEALTNIIRHAEAKNVNISLEEKNGFVKLKITDDGIGITNKEINRFNSFGIMSIKERIIKFNGKLQISGVKNKGTKLNVTIPPINTIEKNENFNS
ncbi:MAG: PAS domain S-box protein, partial [Melioribacteraceae bacterium]|nr:PAS domain S-box protein [Melioribacteraceae bacterium]